VPQGAFTGDESDDFVPGTAIAMYYSSGDPLSRYNRRRFQLVTPSRVASGGVFVGGWAEGTLAFFSSRGRICCSPSGEGAQAPLTTHHPP
jgi:hypothetical protein